MKVNYITRRKNSRYGLTYIVCVACGNEDVAGSNNLNFPHAFGCRVGEEEAKLEKQRDQYAVAAASCGHC